MSEVCALCLQQKSLKTSHIFPRFVGKWLKDNGTGFLAAAQEPSKRVQDLLKIKLLCDDCEQKFSKFENYFASRIFYPYVDAKIPEFDYDENLKSFIISMAWRCLRIVKEDYVKENPASHLNSFVDKADKDWREFLNGDGTSIDSYETHLLFLDYPQSDATTDVDPKFHWYLLHGTDSTVCSNDKRVFFYVKLPWIAFVISIEPQKMDGWHGTIVNKNGHISIEQNVGDGAFGAFLQDRCKLAMHLAPGPDAETSSRRIKQVIKKDREKFLQSNILESLIVERNVRRKKKMEYMPPSVIALVETAVNTGHDTTASSLADTQSNKLSRLVIADKIADLSDEEIKRLDGMIHGVLSLSKILNENKQFTFTSDSIHITYMVSFETNFEVHGPNVTKECEKLEEQTKGKIPCAVFSYFPKTDIMVSGFYVPPVIE